MNKNILHKYVYAWAIGAIFLSLGIFGYSLRAVEWFKAIPGDLCDERFNAVILEHLYGWVMGSYKSLWSPTFLFPFENMLAFSDNHFGSVWSYILLRLAGFGREVAFSGWYVIGNILNFVTAFYVMRRLAFNAFAAAVGAFVFAFALPVLAQEGHGQLNYRFAIPLAFLAFWLFLSKRRLIYLGLTAFWLMIQFYCSIYLGVFLIYQLLGSLAAFLLIKNKNFCLDIKIFWQQEKQKIKWFFGMLFVGSISTTLLLLAKYYTVAADYNFSRSFNEISSMLPRISSYLLADRSSLSSWVGGWISDTPYRHEHQMFFSIGVWCIMLYGVWSIWHERRNFDLGRVLAGSLVVLFLLTIQIGGISFYKLLFYVPGIGSVRAVSRIVLVMVLPISILVAIGCENLFAKNASKSFFIRSILVVFVTVLISGEVFFYKPYTTSIKMWQERQKELLSQMPAKLSSSNILFVTQKDHEPFCMTELDGMILAQDLKLSTLNGYSGNMPPGYFLPNNCIAVSARLLQYIKFRKLKNYPVAEFTNNIIQINKNVCPYLATEVNDYAISSEVAKNINLQLSGATTGGKFVGNIIVTNKSKINFNSLSTKGNFYLSYRFVSLGALPVSKQFEWDARIELFAKIIPGQSIAVPVEINLPTAPGKYLLEASMVQEGVAWLHNFGMIIPRRKFIIH